MENDSTFVAPEGVYSVTEEHKISIAHPNSNPPSFPTRLSTIVVRFPAAKQGGGPPGLAQLLGGNRDAKKDSNNLKAVKEKDDGLSLSSSETPEDDLPNGSAQEHIPASPTTPVEPPAATLFSPQVAVKGFVWIEAGSKAKDPLARITFSAYPTCHDVNNSTASSERLDVIIGFNTGDLVWFDPISSRYCRLNKQGCITSSPCTAVRWVPNSPTLFLVAHADGTIIIYDKERDDGSITPRNHAQASTDANGDAPKPWNPLNEIFVTMPPWHPTAGIGSGKNDKDRAVKNPVSHWRVSNKSVVDFVFSSDNKYVAAISDDGCLRVIDALGEQLLDCYASYFGALTCVAWSPDNRFILTGGQDDLITIFSPWEQRVIARCQGHSSFVSAVAFDDLRCDGRTYRFGSWDFSSGALHRPKFQAHHQRVSMSSTISLAFRRDRSALHLPSLGSPADENSPQRYHMAPSRNEIAVVQPVLVKHLEGDLLAAITFVPQALLTSTKNGHIKLWVRPLASKSRNPRTHNRGQSQADVHGILN
ncbi:hypothetical protein CCMSSC00406_0006181 [Pleurotus cornucopiae]|uniref:Uncharacterized protein n=1 Tax=Pleurotus cornucopiae TaxID=5321 RepID=A0ACB7J964_PLECO|nr:hypothetical protein CCMSSC00406_0006181 [Pleurotus cornucopiae]